MKQALKNLSILTLAAALLSPLAVLAQKEEKEVKEKKDAEEIIIYRKGDKNDKVVIELNGDKVIVNGKEVDKKDSDNIIVHRNKVKDMYSLRRYPGTGVFNGDAMTFFSEDANRAMLGVVTEKTDEGLEIQDITKESAAEKAGLKEGDYITKIDDKKVESPDELSEAIKKHKPGDKVTVTYLRDKKEQKATAELTKWKGVNAWTMGPNNNFKMDLGDMNFDKIMPKIQTVPRVPQGMTWNWSNGPKLGLSIQDTDDGKGVKVLEVDEESNAAKAGVKENDVVTEVDGKAVNSVDEMAKIIRESKDKTSIMLKLQRSGKAQSIEVKMPKRIKTADL